MNSKILKSLIYFIFSAVFVSSTAFFINENYSLRIYLNTLTYTTLNYLWFVVIFTQFIYIYRDKTGSIGNLYLITIVTILIVLVIQSFFDPYDYTSLTRNGTTELYINRPSNTVFSLSKNEYVMELVSSVKIFKPQIVYYFINPALLYFVNNRSNSSSTVLSMIFISEIIFLVFFGDLLYLEFYIISVILLLKFGIKNETV